MADDFEQETKKRGTPVYSKLEPGADGKSTRVVTPDGLALITMLAKNGKPHSLIASKLGMTRHAFRKALGSADSENPVRMAYEKGYGEHEAAVQSELWKKAKKSGHPAPIIFYAKAHLGWRENEAPVIDASQNKIQITLPAPRSFGDTLRALGQRQIADFRKNKDAPIEQVLPPIIGRDGVVYLKTVTAPVEDGDVVDAEFTDVEPRVCSPQHLAYLKANGLYNPKVHLSATNDGGETNGY